MKTINIEKTLNTLWLENNHQLIKGKINLIIAPAGSGKTYWIFETLIKDYNLDKVIYLCDTTALTEAITKDEKYNHLCRLEGKPSKGFNPRIRVMTYSKYGMMINNDPNIFDDVELIICDEAHNLYNYKNKFDDKEREIFTYTKTINDLFNKVENNNVDIIFATATHGKIVDGCKKYTKIDFINEDGVQDVDLLYNFDTKHYRLINFINMDKLYSNIKRLKEDFTYRFCNYRNIIYHLRAYNGFKWGKKCLIYTDRVTTIKDLEQVCSNIGLRAVGIWSKHNKDYKMNDYQYSVRKSIIETGLIPDNVDVLIINSSYETGINIKEENIELVIINSTNIDTQIQARARVRKNIKALLLRSSEDFEDIVITIDDKWLNRKLTKEERDQLCEEYPLYNEDNRLRKWSYLKDVLENSGYVVGNTKITVKTYRDTRVEFIEESERLKLKRKQQEEIEYLIKTFR